MSKLSRRVRALEELLRKSVVTGDDDGLLRKNVEDYDKLVDRLVAVVAARDEAWKEIERLRVQLAGENDLRRTSWAECERLRADLAALYAAVERLRTCSGPEYHGVVNALFALLPGEHLTLTPEPSSGANIYRDAAQRTEEGGGE